VTSDMGRFWVSTPAQRMVAEQLRPHGVTDERVLEAMASVPREEFLAPRMRRHAYEDRALAIECGQTISQPLVVALMAAAASRPRSWRSSPTAVEWSSRSRWRRRSRRTFACIRATAKT